MQLRLSPEAERDIIDIHIFGALHFGVQQADEYLDELQQAIELIAERPLTARARPEFRPPVRVHPHRAHHICYVIDDGSVLIVRLLHHAVDWSRLL